MNDKQLAKLLCATICIGVIVIPLISSGAATGGEVVTIKVIEIPIGKNYTETGEVFGGSSLPSSGSYKLLADLKSCKATGHSNYPDTFNVPAALVERVEKLTQDTADRWDEFPAFSPDGTKIVFESCTMGRTDDPLYDDNIWIMDISANNPKRLTQNEYYDGVPSFSPDGQKIIFSSAHKKLSAEVEETIWTMDIDGLNQKQILIDKTPECPSWSPKGTQKSHYVPGESGHESGSYSGPDSWYEYETTWETAARTFTSLYTRNACRHSSWSPDGSKIIFENFYTIWLMDKEGANLTLLSQEGAVDSYPSWSSDGQEIVFISSLYKNNSTWITDIWTMNGTGSNRKQLTSDEAIEWEPSYSPDGTKIVFTALQSGIPTIWMMNSDGTNKQQLTSRYSAEQPKWSPDGTKIVFASNGDIWMMSLTVTPMVAQTSELAPSISPAPTHLTPTPIITMPTQTLTPAPIPTVTSTVLPTETPFEGNETPGFGTVVAIMVLIALTFRSGKKK